MEHERGDGGNQNKLDFKCKKILPDVEKSTSSEGTLAQSMKVDEKWSVGENLASPTPEKIIQPPRSRSRGNALPVRSVRQISDDLQNEDAAIHSADEKARNDKHTDFGDSKTSGSSLYAAGKLQEYEGSELPDKYKIVADFFDSMVTSLRLLGLRKKMSSFQNISIQVEILSKRRFLHSHLAQIKYLFPEAIQIDKILIHDESTLCMKPDMKITLSPDVLGRDLEESLTMALHKIFRERLLDFISAHPEGNDIPEALLPEPFNKRNNDILLQSWTQRSSSESPHPTSSEFESLTNASHLSQFFCRQFSKKMLAETEKTPLLDSPVLLSSITKLTTTTGSHHDNGSPMKKDTFSSSYADTKSPVELVFSQDCYRNPNFSEKTPTKPSHFSTPAKLSETPAQATPKRLMPSPHDNAAVATVIASNLAPRRVLFSSSLKAESDSNLITHVTENDGDESMPGGVHLENEYTKSSATVIQSEQNQAGLSKRQQMLICLPDLFNTVRVIFQSAHRSSITKQELVHKIIMNNFDIVETGEVEEKLELLEELVPDWICRKTVSSGDCLYYIRKSSDPNSILERIAEAKFIDCN